MVPKINSKNFLINDQSFKGGKNWEPKSQVVDSQQNNYEIPYSDVMNNDYTHKTIKESRLNQHRHLMREIDHSLNLQIGYIFSSNSIPESLGFRRREHKRREIPKFLYHQGPQLSQIEFEQDPWDKSNQEKMLSLENSVVDTVELWETLKKMREIERKVMESKGLVDKAELSKSLNDAIVFRGTCQDMCPIFERARRSVENNVVRYEKDDINNKRILRSKALKVFSRPAAAAAPPLPSDVRPPRVLVKTLDYVVNNIIQLLPDCEGFLWDRMRSIRQDFTYQNYCGPEAVDCNERIVRIHLLILHVMAKSDVKYSKQQELEQLHKALITLSEIYDDVRNSGGNCPNESEFRAYSLLSKIRDPEYDRMIQNLPNKIFYNDMVQLAICFRKIISNSNYLERGYIRTENGLNLFMRFFKLIQSDNIPFFMCSFLQIYLNEIRFYAFKSLSLSINKRQTNLPYSYFVDNMLFNDINDLLSFCKYYSIECDGVGVSLKSLNYHSHIIPETKPLKQSYLKCVDQKLKNVNLVNLINFGECDWSFVLDSNSKKDITTSHLFYDAKLSKTHYPSPKLVSTKCAFNNHTPDSFKDNQSVNSVQYTTNSIKLDTNKIPNENNIINYSVVKIQGSDEQKKIHQSKLEAVDDNKVTLNAESVDFATKQVDKKYQDMHHLAVAEVTEHILKEVVMRNLSNIIDLQLQNKIKKQNRLKHLTKDLFEAFIHEKLYFVFLQVKADIFSTTRLCKKVFSEWKNVYLLRKSQLEDRKRKYDELLKVGRQLGIPSRKDIHRFVEESDLNISNISFIGSPNLIINTPVLNEQTHFTTPMKKNLSIWEPLNLKNIYFNVIAVNLALIDQSDLKANTVNNKQEIIEVLIYSKNWESISGRWLSSKFSLKEGPKIVIQNRELRLNVRKLNSDFLPSKFTFSQLLIFNTGVTDSDIFDLEMSLKQDGERLIELVHGIALNTNYKFSILLVYWESTKNKYTDSDISRLLKLNKILKLFGNMIINTEFVIMTGENEPHQKLVNSLTKIAKNFKFKLTERGEYNDSLLRRHLAGIGSKLNKPFFKSSNDLDKKLHTIIGLENEKVKMEQSKKNVYARLQKHISASPKLKKTKLSVLLSESNKNKFKTPLVSHHDKISSIGTTSASLPSIPSHLVSKVRRVHVTQPVTPSQTRNCLNGNQLLLETPSIASIGGQGTMNNLSGFSSVAFTSQFMTPATKIISHSPKANSLLPHHHNCYIKSCTDCQISQNTSDTQDEIPDSVLELKNLIATVRKSLKK